MLNDARLFDGGGHGLGTRLLPLVQLWGRGMEEGVGGGGGGATVQIISRNEADNLQRSQINAKHMCGCGRAVPSG